MMYGVIIQAISTTKVKKNDKIAIDMSDVKHKTFD